MDDNIEEKSNSINSRLHNKSLIKYTIFFLMIILLPIFIISVLIQSEKLMLCFPICIILIVILLVIWKKRYNYHEDLINIDNRRAIYFFLSKEKTHFFYLDCIIWLGWDVKHLWRQPGSDDEINALKLLVCDDVHSWAIKYEDDFRKLCSQLAKEKELSQRTKIIKKVFSTPKTYEEKYKIERKWYFSDVSLSIYVVLIGLHIFACLLSRKGSFKTIYLFIYIL